MADPIKSLQTPGSEISADGIPSAPVIPPPQATPPPAANQPSTSKEVNSMTELEPAALETENQPTNEPAKEQEVNIDDFLSIKTTVDDKVKEVPAAQQTTPKVEPPEQKTTTVPPATTPQQQQQKPNNNNARDYSGIDESEVPLFKTMSNESFNKLKPLYLDRKEKITALNAAQQKIADLEKGIVKIPESYYEHPQAVLLTPEFATAGREAQLAERIQQHWNNQLAAVREGAVKFQNLQFDANGREVVTELPADAKSEGMILQAISEANNYAINKKAELQAVIRNHQTKNTEAFNQLQTFEKQTFAAFDKPENASLMQLVEATKKTFHPAYQNNPLASGYAKALVAIQQLFGIITKLQSNGTTVTNGNGTKPATNTTLTDQQRAGPTIANAGGGGGGKSNDSDVTVDDFERAKGGY